jgi:hypothetical protein
MKALRHPHLHGLTMIETLLALSLLAAILVASGSWVALAGRAGLQTVEPIRREMAAQAVLNLIHDDLVSGDFDVKPERTNRDDRAPRVRVQEGDGGLSLEIDGRTGVHIYHLDSRNQRLERTWRDRTATERRALLSGVSEFTINLDDEHRVLDVTLTLAASNGQSPLTLARRYRLT